jgi:hypothetical protein
MAIGAQCLFGNIENISLKFVLIPMRQRYIFIIALVALTLISAGCTTPSPTATPTPAATPTPLEPTPTPEATPVATPTPEPSPVVTPVPKPSGITQGTMLNIKDLSIYWDTTGPLQYEKAEFKIMNVDKNQILLDVNVILRIATPTTIIYPDGTSFNTTQVKESTISLGTLRPLETKSVSLTSSNHREVETLVSIIVNWRGGSEKLFEVTLNAPDNNFGVIEY